MEPHGFDNLGGQSKTPDDRDLLLGSAIPVYTFTPAVHDVSAWEADVEYQGKQPACGAHAGTKAKGLKDDKRYSPRYTWANLKTFDGWTIESGTDIRSIMKSLTGAGPLDFPQMGNDITLDLNTYAHPVITPAMAKLATANKGFAYGFANDLSFNGLKQYIHDHGPIILLMRVTERFWTAENGMTSWAEKDILPLAPPSAHYHPVSGHFVVAHSYDEKYIYFLNSFSKDWGRKGHGYFGEDYMPMINDAGALVPMAFSRDLYEGMQHPDVKKLQQWLNKDPKFQVAKNGPGSPGQETEYFGSLTKAAVIRFQTARGIKPAAGYVGHITRAVINA